MLKKCSLCNNDFILTSNDLVVADQEDMYRKWIECLACSKETRNACNEILKWLPKRETKEEPSIEEFKKRFDNNTNNKKKRKF